MKPLETVIFIQHMMHSRLFKRMREKLSDIKKVGRIKVKMVKRCVDKLTDLLHKSYPWSVTGCGREDCWPCALSGEETSGKGE